MLKHNIIGMTIIDLYNNYINYEDALDDSMDFGCLSPDASKDQGLREVFEDSSNDLVTENKNSQDLDNIIDKNGSNMENEEDWSKSKNTTKQTICGINLWTMLHWFVKKQSGNGTPFHLFLDDVPLVHLTPSKRLISFCFLHYYP